MTAMERQADPVQEHGALFLSTERDQIRRGVLKAPPKG
jgi:hypothetical protein